jgi:hypothetical protein
MESPLHPYLKTILSNPELGKRIVESIIANSKDNSPVTMLLDGDNLDVKIGMKTIPTQANK